MVARRLAGYAVAMEVARRAEGPEVNGDLRKTVSRRSLVPSRELKRKGYIVVDCALIACEHIKFLVFFRYVSYAARRGAKR